MTLDPTIPDTPGNAGKTQVSGSANPGYLRSLVSLDVVLIGKNP